MIKTTILTLLSILFFSQTAAAESYTLGTYPFGKEENIYAAFSTLTEYLSEKSGDDFRLVITQDYNELSERIIEGSVDFTWIGSANYIKTRKAGDNVVYMATYREWNSDHTRVQPYYQSVILVLKSSTYTDLNGIKGTRFAFTSPDSTSGYAYPQMIFKNMGIDPDDYFANVFFMGRHSNVIKALVAGSIDAGSCSDGTYYNAVKNYGDIFRVLKFSEPIPLDAFVSVSHVAPDKRQEVLDLLLAIGTDHPVNDSIIENLSWPSAGFEVKSPEFYDSVEEAMRIMDDE